MKLKPATLGVSCKIAAEYPPQIPKSMVPKGVRPQSKRQPNPNVLGLSKMKLPKKRKPKKENTRVLLSSLPNYVGGLGGVRVKQGPAPGEKTTRYDINRYGGGASHIRHIGLIKKRPH